MAQERGSAAVSVGLVMMLATAFLLLSHSEAAQYTLPWDVNVRTNQAAWLKGKKFYAKDKIVFQYTQGQHNVVPVNPADYGSCTAGGKTYSAGNDSLALSKGDNYFICSFTGHCKNLGMKIKVHAA